MCRAHPVLTASNGSQGQRARRLRHPGRLERPRRPAAAAARSCGGRLTAASTTHRQLVAHPVRPRAPPHHATRPQHQRSSSAARPRRCRAVLPGPPHPPRHPPRQHPALRRGRAARLHRGRRAASTESREPSSPGSGVDTAIDNGSTFIMATELTPQGPRHPHHPHLLRIRQSRLAPLPRPNRPVRPQTMGHRTIHPSPDQRRPPPANHHPAQLTPIGLTPGGPHVRLGRAGQRATNLTFTPHRCQMRMRSFAGSYIGRSEATAG